MASSCQAPSPKRNPRSSSPTLAEAQRAAQQPQQQERQQAKRAGRAKPSMHSSSGLRGRW